MSALGDKIRDFISDGNMNRHADGYLRDVALMIDRQADLLDRERDTQQHTMRANLDLIKRLKDANEKLEAIRSLALSGYSLDPVEIRAILDGQHRTSDEVLADLRKRLAGD